MENTTPLPKATLKPVITLIVESWNQLAERVKLYWPYSLGLLALLATMRIIRGNTAQQLTLTVESIIYYVVASLIIYLLGLALTLRLNWPEKNHLETIKGSFKLYAPLAYLILLTGLVQIGAYSLLIIPGLIASVHLALAYYVKILENIGGYKALTRSRQLVKGNFWQTVWRYIIFSVLGALPSVVLGFFPQTGVSLTVSAIIYGFVQAFWAMPFLMLGLLNISQELMKQKPTPSVEKKGYYVFCSIWGPIFGLVVIGGAVILSGLSLLNAQNQLQKIDTNALVQKYQPQIEVMLKQGKNQTEIENAIKDMIMKDYAGMITSEMIPKNWNALQERLKLWPDLKTLFQQNASTK